MKIQEQIENLNNLIEYDFRLLQHAVDSMGGIDILGGERPLRIIKEACSPLIDGIIIAKLKLNRIHTELNQQINNELETN